jgi:hypothetical protein
MSPILLTLITLLAMSAEPTPTPTPTATPEATPTPAINILLKQQTAPGGSSGGQDLSQVAKRIKLKLPANQPRRLDNDAVKQLAKGVELTQVKAEPSPLAVGASAGDNREDETKQRFWVNLYQAARGYVKGLEELIPQLDGEINRLRTAFYSTDDPARRDGVIKPAWDKAVADWDQAKKDLEQARGLLGKVSDAARRDGALPGWFRGLPEPEATLDKPVIPAPAAGGESERDKER